MKESKDSSEKKKSEETTPAKVEEEVEKKTSSSEKKSKKKKEKESSSTKSVETETSPTTEQSETQTDENSKSKKNSKNIDTKPFRRIKEEEIEIEKEELKDNTYYAKRGDSWGYKANQDLEKVKGRDFRHEKTKKKRGSYKGGPIDMGVNSIKFESSDDDS